ncbi:hypothetical protein [Actinoplanes sp. GCM10030250]|uniref:hypothetical protein n=1 Tax=Actinoplanes sp. GCM10030250 TaxID=3273376 RepID=UPI00360DB95C
MIDLDSVDRDAVMNCYTPRQVYAMAQAVAAEGTGRDVVAHLVQTAMNLSAMAAQISQAYLQDSYDPALTDQAGLHPYRHQVLAAAATCAHNAALFLQEAQRRPALRASGYDPLIMPQPA